MKKHLSLILSCCLAFCLLAVPINAEAHESTGSAVMQYYSSGWKNMSSGKAEASGIGAIYIKTSFPDYYLRYRVRNSGQSGYFSYVNSNNGLPVSDSASYAGSLKGSVIRLLNIDVMSQSGAVITNGVYAMYRVKVDTGWYSWVCTGGYEQGMKLASKYGLSGGVEQTDSYAGSTSKNITALEIRIFDERSAVSGEAELIEVAHIYQGDSWPTGCESVSSVMALKHAGVDISVDSFIDNYLEKGSYNNFHPDVCFGGDPRGQGMGCYSPVIKKACDKLLSGTDYQATELKGKSIEFLLDNYIDKGIPVIFWATSNMSAAYNGRQYTYNGVTYTWIAPEHCLLLVGYDDYYYIFNDPLKTSAPTYYFKSEVEAAYSAMGSQAVVIEKREHNYLSEVIPPDCVNPGFTRRTCSYCGEAFTDCETPALGHNVLEWNIIKQAGFTFPALKQGACSACAEAVTISEGYALCDFNFDGVVNSEDYSCLEAGEAEPSDITPFDFDKSGSIGGFDMTVIRLLISGIELDSMLDVNLDGSTDTKDLVRIKTLFADGSGEEELDVNFESSFYAEDLIFARKFILIMT